MPSMPSRCSGHSRLVLEDAQLTGEADGLGARLGGRRLHGLDPHKVGFDDVQPRRLDHGRVARGGVQELSHRVGAVGNRVVAPAVALWGWAGGRAGGGAGVMGVNDARARAGSTTRGDGTWQSPPAAPNAAPAGATGLPAAVPAHAPSRKAQARRTAQAATHPPTRVQRVGAEGWDDRRQRVISRAVQDSSEADLRQLMGRRQVGRRQVAGAGCRRCGWARCGDAHR